MDILSGVLWFVGAAIILICGLLAKRERVYRPLIIWCFYAASAMYATLGTVEILSGLGVTW